MNTASTHKALFLLTTALILLPSTQGFALDSKATPSGEVVVGGTVTFNRPAPGQLDVNQSSGRAVINWDSFDIGKNATTEFHQPNAAALAVNRVTGPGSDPTQILGTLKANGRIMVLDRNGILFGKDSVVDVGGIVASTGDVSDASVLGGDTEFTLTDFGDNALDMRGKISVADAGLAAFVAPAIKNSGLITARLGRVELAAGGSKTTVDFYGDKLIEIVSPLTETEILLQNGGKIAAENGIVTMTTGFTKNILVDSVINLSGIVDVGSVTRDGGKIILKAAGDIHLTPSGRLNANSVKEKGGDITLFTDFSRPAIISGHMTANGAKGGGNVTIPLSGDLDVTKTGKITANSTKGKGGKIHIGEIDEDHGFPDDSKTTINGQVESSGATGGGSVRILSNNEGLTISKTARLIANSTKGKGGDLYLNSRVQAATVDGQMKSSGATGGGLIQIENGSPGIDLAPFFIGETARLLTEGRNSGTGGNIDISSQAGADNDGENDVPSKIEGHLITRGKHGGGNIRITNELGTDFTEDSLLHSQATGSGKGGNINLFSRNGLSIVNHAGRMITEGKSGGGNIRFDTDQIYLSENSTLESRSSHGSGGNIELFGGHDVGSKGLISSTGKTKGGKINLGADVTLVYEPSLIKSEGTGSNGKGGSIIIGGDGTGVSGNVSANGPSGGGRILIAGGGGAGIGGKSILSAKATNKGVGGEIIVNSGLEGSIGGTLDVTGKDGGGKINVFYGQGLTIDNTSRFLAESIHSGRGGEILIEGDDIDQGGLINASGVEGGGKISIHSGNDLFVAGELRADAKKSGNGGEIDLRGFNGNVLFSGDIFARGGSISGNGGNVFFSSPNVIAPGATIDLSAPNGNDGVFTH